MIELDGSRLSGSGQYDPNRAEEAVEGFGDGGEDVSIDESEATGERIPEKPSGESEP